MCSNRGKSQPKKKKNFKFDTRNDKKIKEKQHVYESIITLQKQLKLNELCWIWLAKAAVAVNTTKYKLITSNSIYSAVAKNQKVIQIDTENGIKKIPWAYLSSSHVSSFVNTSITP